MGIAASKSPCEWVACSGLPCKSSTRPWRMPPLSHRWDGLLVSPVTTIFPNIGSQPDRFTSHDLLLPSARHLVANLEEHCIASFTTPALKKTGQQNQQLKIRKKKRVGRIWKMSGLLKTIIFQLGTKTTPPSKWTKNKANSAKHITALKQQSSCSSPTSFHQFPGFSTVPHRINWAILQHLRQHNAPAAM